MGRDRGRESALESVWRRRSQGKVRTWDGSAADLGRNGRGPGTEMWDWWPVVLQVRESTVSGLGNGSGPGTGKWPGERMASQVPGESADLGRNGRGPGTESQVTGNTTTTDRGRGSGLESIWRRRSWGKVRTGDGTTEDRGHKAHGPGTQRPRTGDTTAEDLGRKVK